MRSENQDDVHRLDGPAVAGIPTRAQLLDGLREMLSPLLGDPASPVLEPSPPCPACANALLPIDHRSVCLWLCEACDLTMRRY